MMRQLIILLTIPLLVVCRLTEQTGKDGDVFQVNDYKSQSQEHPALAALPGGGFIAVWHDEQDGSSDGIYYQIYSASGVRVSNEVQVNTYTQSHQRFPSVAVFTDGSFVIVWHSNGQDGDAFGIFGQLFSQSGVPVGDEFLINTITESNQLYPEVTSITDGFVVIWQSSGGLEKGIYGQLFNRDGSRKGDEFAIAVRAHAAVYHVAPAISSSPTGGFVVVWRDRSEGVFTISYDSFGRRVHQPIRVAGSGEYEVAGLNGDGSSSYVITRTNESGLFVHMYSSDGGEIGIGMFQVMVSHSGTTPATVATKLQSGENPAALVAKSDGGFTVVWKDSDNSLHGITFAPLHELTSDGNPHVDGEFAITVSQTGLAFPSVAALGGQKIVAIWQTGTFREGFDVWGQLFAPQVGVPPTPPPTPFPTFAFTAVPVVPTAVPTTVPTAVPTTEPETDKETRVPSPTEIPQTASPNTTIPQQPFAQVKDSDGGSNLLSIIIISACGGVFLVFAVVCVLLRRSQQRMNKIHYKLNQNDELKFEDVLDCPPPEEVTTNPTTGVECEDSSSGSDDDERTPMIPAKRLVVRMPKNSMDINNLPPSPVAIFDFQF